MVDREKLLQEILSIHSKYLCLELATGVGKTRIALEWIEKNKPKTVLVVVPRLVLIDNFKQELIKWHKEKLLPKIEFTTYISFTKYDLSQFDLIVFDEAHHLSNRCVEHIKNQIFNKVLLLSATINESKKIQIKEVFEHIIFYKVSASDAINSEILPEPRIYLWELSLDNTNYSEIIPKKGTSSRTIRCKYEDRFKFLSKYKTCNILIKCTEKQKYEELNRAISYWKERYYETRSLRDKNIWLQQSLKRLKWLSDKKQNYIKALLSYLKDERVITFCNSIKHAESLNSNCISSKNKKAIEVLQDFNTGKINAITAVNMLNEGANLVNCRVGVWAVINASQVMQIQKLGRNLRHPNPIIVIPYYLGTREKDIIQEFVHEFDSNTVSYIKELKDIIL